MATKTEKIVFHNVFILDTDKAKIPYYEYNFMSGFDAVDDITVDVNGLDVELFWNVNGKIFGFKYLKEILFCCSMYNIIKLHIKFITLPEPGTKPEISVNGRYSIFSKTLRNILQTRPVTTETNIYKEGMLEFVRHWL